MRCKAALLLLAVTVILASSVQAVSNEENEVPSWVAGLHQGPYVVPLYYQGEKVTDPDAIESLSALRYPLATPMDRELWPETWKQSRDEVFDACKALVWYNPFQQRWVCYGSRGHRKPLATGSTEGGCQAS